MAGCRAHRSCLGAHGNAEDSAEAGRGAMTKSSELREMSDDQLSHELRESQESLFRLRFQAASERLDAQSNLMKLRRTIARIKTIQGERLAAAEATQD